MIFGLCQYQKNTMKTRGYPQNSIHTQLYTYTTLYIHNSIHTQLGQCWFSHQVMCNSCNLMDCSPWGSSVHGISKARIVGCHFLLQRIFLTQGSNPDLMHCRQILYSWATGEAPCTTPIVSKRQHNTCLGKCISCHFCLKNFGSTYTSVYSWPLNNTSLNHSRSTYMWIYFFTKYIP